ncbi:MAG: SUMF1/EgtB/PvdO family nonheme iron enzyme [Thermoguttaceae bacterium]
MKRFFLTFVMACLAAATVHAGEFTIDAFAFDRGNFAVFQDNYRNGGPVIIANGSGSPATVEYDIPFPVAGEYTLSVFVAAAEKRPLTVFVDGNEVGTICNDKLTPSWNSIDATWDAPIKLNIAGAKTHTVKLVSASGPPPHVASLKFVTDAPFPDGWTLVRPKAKTLPVIVAPSHTGYDLRSAALPNPAAIRRAIDDLIVTFGTQYPNGKAFLDELSALEKKSQRDDFGDIRNELADLQRRAVFIENPVIDFETLICIRRNQKGDRGGFPQNWESYSSIARSGFDDAIVAFPIRKPESPLVMLYMPPRDTIVTDLDLDFDASRLMFSAVGDNGRYHIFEAKIPSITSIDDTVSATKVSVPQLAPNQLTSGDSQLDFYDSCYLPDGRIILTNTASMTGVPCVAGSSHVANLFLFDPQSTEPMRQLGFDQEHNWCPEVLNNGRVLYSRWEYADTPHSNTRLLFNCNPDGTSQLEFYGSNSYWPTSVFYARPLPNHPTQVICVVGGHHDNGRVGELVILDPAISRYEAEGAVQRIPGFGKKVETIVSDGLTRNSYPKFAHPMPLSDKYFLVTAKPSPSSLFGIYLVDVFDNVILVKELAENLLVEPTPLRTRVRPPIIPDKVDLARDDAEIYISDILGGAGLEGVPRGVVKSLRVFTYHFAYHGTGGLYGSVGQDGPWDVRGVLGTVPVEDDGSVLFRAPANVPIGVLPLDANGQALQLMRSWMTAMPGEFLQCNGCHEPQNTAPPNSARHTLALRKGASEIVPWNNPNASAQTLLGQLNVRGFAFQNEVQPILDRHCVECHNGEGEKTADVAHVNDHPVGTSRDGKPFAINLRGDQMVEGWSSEIAGSTWVGTGGKWSVGYDNLQRFVRRPGIESDYQMFVPMEYAANTTELVQILRAGHYGVSLSADEWQKLLTWIDMNAPYHGNWSDMNKNASLANIARQRIDFAKLYGGEAVDFEGAATPPPPAEVKLNAFARLLLRIAETIPDAPTQVMCVVAPSTESTPSTMVLGGIEFVRIPTGRIEKRARDHWSAVTIEKPFWISSREITNGEFREFDPSHKAHRESRMAYQFGRRGYDVDDDDLPAVRVSWRQANDYAAWLSAQTGKNVSLPNEFEWEWAARGGHDTPFWFGDLDTDFAAFENLGDVRLKEFVACTTHGNYTSVRLIENPNPFDDRFPKDERFDDGHFLQTKPASYAANPFGVFDVHGNVAEWTSSVRGEGSDAVATVCGGSWYDRPYRGTADFRRYYPTYQKVYKVGIRLVVREP